MNFYKSKRKKKYLQWGRIVKKAYGEDFRQKEIKYFPPITKD